MEIFGTIYCWFESLFGQNLAEHLWGWDESTGDYIKTNLFNVVGIIAVVIALLMSFGFYRVLNHPRFNRWWSWLIVLGIVGVTNLFIGFYFPFADLVNDNISADITEFISVADCWMFGVANFIVSVSFFFIFSFFLKKWSSNCKRSPFAFSL